MTLNHNALSSVEEVRLWLCQGRAQEPLGRLADEALIPLINAASSAVESWCQRCLIAPATPQLYYASGLGGSQLLLPEWPAVSVEQVTIDDQVIPQLLLPGQTGWRLRAAEGLLLLTGYRFAVGQDNVVIRGRLGYDEQLAADSFRHRRALEDLRLACWLLCALWWEKPAAGGGTVRDDGWVRTWQAAPVAPEVQALLRPYRRLEGA